MPHDGIIRVEDLLRAPALQLRLIAGAEGVSRRVAWAHVSELEDPTPWLSGAEMIMTTGMALRRRAERQREYLERLDDAGVSCLALSEGMFVPPLTGAFIETAERRSFPVVEVPIPVPFIAISQEVAAAVQRDTGQRLNAQLQVFSAIRWIAEGRLSTREIFARLERLSGYTLYACTPGRGPLLDGVPLPEDDLADLIPDATTSISPPTVPGGYLLPVSGPHGTAGYILALERQDAAPAGVSAVQHIATVASLRLAMLAHEREVTRREGAEVLAEMLQGMLEPAVVARRLAARGFEPGRPLAFAVIRPTSETTRRQDAADALATSGLPHLVLAQQEEIYALLPDDPAASGALASLRAAAGLSRPFDTAGSISAARREAQWAVTRAVETGLAVARYEDGRAERWLTTEPADLRGLVADVLGAVRGYDAQHGSGLVATLRTWLEHDRDTRRAARILQIHPNTLLYRLRRFEQVSGRSLASTESLAELWLALRAADSAPTVTAPTVSSGPRTSGPDQPAGLPFSRPRPPP